MAVMRKRPIRYKKNPPPLREQGPRTFCEVSGFPTYQGRMIQDDYGQRVDPRYGGFDFRTGRDEEGE